jgi:hypothetical protein
MAKMTDRQERERLDEGMWLLRSFFRIKDQERRRDVIAIVEDVAAAAAEADINLRTTPAESVENDP